MRDAYIVESVRTPGCRRNKGLLAQTRPEDLITTALKGLVERSGVDKASVDDIMMGCAFPEAEQGINIGRISALMAGFPITTSGATVNRFCSSGIEAIALSSFRVMTGMCEAAIGGGVESMSIVPMGGNLPRPHPEWSKTNPEVYMSMGITAENVAQRYNVTREEQDYFGYHSNMKAAKAQKEGLFKEIVPVQAYKWNDNGDGSFTKETYKVDHDDGIRATATVEGMGKLRGAFSTVNPNKPNSGSVTAANSSQTTDGAGATLVMSKEECERQGLKPIAKLVKYAVAGCEADEMGVGPKVAIPKVLKLAGLTINDIIKDGLIELNEAFASQSIHCSRELGIGDEKYWAVDSPDLFINVNGGAIALGHPLGCTGAKLTATLMANMKRMGKKYGIVSMCIGGGMGAAALFESVD
ncbi:MAG: thiolase family protein [Bacteroidales bacterium]|jgi:acetyl-CoA acyltransferase|nr:thiolase family protein [Bacteroidales bacterium]